VVYVNQWIEVPSGQPIYCTRRVDVGRGEPRVAGPDRRLATRSCNWFLVCPGSGARMWFRLVDDASALRAMANARYSHLRCRCGAFYEFYEIPRAMEAS
jgi:hypothetical protein